MSPSTLPLGVPVPAAGPLEGIQYSQGRTFSAYVHIPFCRVRCGYCDFNTYTAKEIRGVNQLDYIDIATAEVDQLATEMSGLVPERKLHSIFVGGGTPTLLPAGHLAKMIKHLTTTWGLEPGAEITVEANPDSIGAEGLAELAASGVNRVSFGMQSAVPRVLGILERTHTSERVPQVVQWAKAAGLHVSIDVIYGAPTETMDEWRRTVDSVVALDTGHVSAYSLIVEAGTKMARKISKGEIPEPDDDLSADKYEYADAQFTAAGLNWYELSNWAKSEREQSAHNVAYWLDQDWVGIGPGAHSHLGNVRWWNVKHPAAYAGRMPGSPAFAREFIDADTHYEEQVLLRSRLRAGLPVSVLRQGGSAVAKQLCADGLLDSAALAAGHIVLTLHGRLLADLVVRRLLAASE